MRFQTPKVDFMVQTMKNIEWNEIFITSLWFYEAYGIIHQEYTGSSRELIGFRELVVNFWRLWRLLASIKLKHIYQNTIYLILYLFVSCMFFSGTSTDSGLIRGTCKERQHNIIILCSQRSCIVSVMVSKAWICMYFRLFRYNILRLSCFV